MTPSSIPTRDVGKATKEALEIGDRLSAWARRDRERRVREAARLRFVDAEDR